MAKKTKGIQDTPQALRLQEIAAMAFGTLSDDQVSQILAERKQLLEEEKKARQEREAETKRLEYEKQRQAEERAAQKQQEKILQELAALNQSITPEKGDDELLALVAKRKQLEEQLEHLKESLLPAERDSVAAVSEEAAQGGMSTVHTESAPLSARESGVQAMAPSTPAQEEFGQEAISGDDFSPGSQFREQLDRLREHTESLGTLLQQMPPAMKQNKTFMLKVAEIDPAYAMHYADAALKKNEDFNIRIAAMKNPRNSGNAVAEMLPEMRTSKVVLAAVKQDYRNVRFVRPEMEAYAEILRIAKQGTREMVARLKEATDTSLLVPRVLHQDKEFMREVTALTLPLEQQAAPQEV